METTETIGGLIVRFLNHEIINKDSFWKRFYSRRRTINTSSNIIYILIKIGVVGQLIVSNSFHSSLFINYLEIFQETQLDGVHPSLRQVQ